ncbi:MAG: hypothetical protein VKP62_16430, partial [Candidatus Sericytochromatia bacterium]|nr:hypothetical protein [Candidatus Sericytochromatia bacterium]
MEAPSAGTGKPKAGTAQLRGDSNLAAGLASKVLNSELAGAGKKAAGGAFGVYEAANSFIDGGSRALQGEFEGMVDLGQASVDLVKNAAETLQGAGNLSKQFNAQTGRLAKLAETISQNLDEGAKFGKGLSMAGSVFGGLGGAVSVKKGVEEIQAGDTVGGSAKVTRGVGNVLDGAAGVTQMVAKSGSTIAKAGAVAGRIAPV